MAGAVADDRQRHRTCRRSPLPLSPELRVAAELSFGPNQRASREIKAIDAIVNELDSLRTTNGMTKAESRKPSPEC